MRTIKIWKESLDASVSVSKPRFISNQTNSQEGHQERDEAVPSPFEYFQEGGKEWSTEGKSDQPAFDSIRDEQCRSCLIKPVLFLENKGLIDGERDAWDRGNEE